MNDYCFLFQDRVEMREILGMQDRLGNLDLADLLDHQADLVRRALQALMETLDKQDCPDQQDFLVLAVFQVNNIIYFIRLNLGWLNLKIIFSNLVSFDIFYFCKKEK